MPREETVITAELLKALVTGPLSRAEVEARRDAIDRVEAADVIDAVDLAVAERMKDGGAMDSLKPAVSRLLNLLRQPLASRGRPSRDPFFALLELENRRALVLLEGLRAPVATLASSPAPDEGATRDARATLAASLSSLAPGLELHYARLENVLFPAFEARHENYRCLSLMWSIHDDVRRSLRALALAAEGSGDEGSGDGAGGGASRPSPVAALAGKLFFDVNALVFREEAILYPVVARLLGRDDCLKLYREARELGRGLLEERDLDLLEARAGGYEAALGAGPAGGEAADTRPSPDPAGLEAAAPWEAIALDSGALTPATIDAIMKRIDLDLTFIDAAGRVAWFSNGPHRVFPRSPAIIGRDVRNCHPHESVGRVMALVDDFREGRREREAFWIERAGRFVHIEYFALRAADGSFLGVLEASEDLTGKRALTGEKRLASGR